MKPWEAERGNIARDEGPKAGETWAREQGTMGEDGRKPGDPC